MVYSLKWSASFVSENGLATFETLPSPSGAGSVLSYTIPNGILVKKGDVLGYYIKQNPNPIRMGYFNTTTMESDISYSVVYSLEGVDGPLCNMSLCDSNVKSIHHAAPIIYAELGK